jgi:signal transduction histidine kinase
MTEHPHSDAEGTSAAARDLHLDDLLREVLDRVHGVLDDRQRWQLLLDAVVTMAADLTLDELLGRIVEIAADLSGARYAALGVLDEEQAGRLRLFLTRGMSEAEIKEVGDLPTGHGLLGLIIERPEPVRLHDIAAHPSSYGFPPKHPPMTSFLGVPLRIRDKVFGNLYLTEKEGGADFTEQDEQIVVALAAAAGVAVENARLHEEAHRREAWLAATAEITGLLAGSESTTEALQAIADRARELSGADVAWVVAGDENSLAVEVVSGAPADPSALAALDLHHSLAQAVAESGTSATVEDLAHDPRVLDLATVLGWPALGPAVMVPLRNRLGAIGVLALAWRPEHQASYSQLDTALPTRFAEHAALALSVARSRRDEQRLALYQDRDRIARDLHDLVIQRLFAAGLSLQSGVRHALPPEKAPLLDTVVDELDATIKDIRRTIFALGAMADAGANLQDEITRLVERAAGTLKFRPTLELRGPIRTLVPEHVAPELLAVLGELLSNAARHAAASKVDVCIIAGEQLELTLADDGRGLPPGTTESGLANARTRAERLGGTFEVESAPGRGTRITWRVPLLPR